MKSAMCRPPTTAVVLPDDLIAELLSFLPVKIILQFRCVSKSWKALISDPTFVKLHLNRSASRNPQFTLVTCHGVDVLTLRHSVFPYSIHSLIQNPSFTHSVHDPHTTEYRGGYVFHLGCSVVPYSMSRLIDNPSFTLDPDPDCCFFFEDYRIVGSCNGLINFSSHYGSGEYRLKLWNPATMKTRILSANFHPTFSSNHDRFKFNFGCDNATGTYKVVASCYNPDHQFRSNVRILTVDDNDNDNDNVWRDIESFPVVPLHLDNDNVIVNVGVYLSSTFNWLAIRNDFHYNFKDIKVDQFVIVSLDLGTETYNKYMLPRGFDEVPHVEPTIGVLGGCLCFSYSKDTHFVIWRMMKFRAEDCWTQFLNLSYQDLQIDYTYSYYETFQLVPLLLYEDGHTLILKSNYNKDAIIYNWRDNKVGRTEITTRSKNSSTY